MNPAVAMYRTPADLPGLVAEYRDWSERHMDGWNTSADELLASGRPNAIQRAWLLDYIRRWDAALDD